MKTRTLLSALALGAGIALSLPSNAHNAWLMPSATVLQENQWITVDAAVSNDLFFFNHVPLRLDTLTITAPDGSTVQPQNPHTGHYRSVFDVELNVAGTWRIALVNQGMFASWEENGAPKRWRGTAERFESEVPKDAARLQVTQSTGRIETFVTAGAPDTRALAPTNVGLELAPVTHPNDLFAGESAQFALLLDGKPAAGVEVALTPGGTRYRTRLGEVRTRTDAEGKFSFEFPAPGMYWLEAAVLDDKGVTPPATQRRATYVATFEVLPQ